MDREVPRLPGSRLAAFEREHPEVSACCVGGTWHAWIPDGHGGAETHGRTLDELLAKLAAALGG